MVTNEKRKPRLMVTLEEAEKILKEEKERVKRGVAFKKM